MGLKKKEIEKFHQRLLEIKGELTHHLADANEGVRASDESKGYSQHQADEGTDDFDRTITLQLSNTEMEVLRQVERALKKIEEDTYGVCDLTGESIPKARLEVIPYATMTVEAQDKMERGLL